MIYKFAFFIAIVVMAVTLSAEENEGYITFEHNNNDKRDYVVVAEFFWYGCPTCYQLEKYVTEWLKQKPDYIHYKRMPADLGKKSIPHIRAYFTAEKLGLLDTFHNELFDAIHKDGRIITTDSDLKSFFMELGVEEELFNKTYSLPEIAEDVRFAQIMSSKYAIRGVPAFVVDGQYGTSVTLAGGYNEVFNVIELLAKKQLNQSD